MIFEQNKFIDQHTSCTEATDVPRKPAFYRTNIQPAFFYPSMKLNYFTWTDVIS